MVCVWYIVSFLVFDSVLVSLDFNFVESCVLVCVCWWSLWFNRVGSNMLIIINEIKYNNVILVLYIVMNVIMIGMLIRVMIIGSSIFR